MYVTIEEMRMDNQFKGAVKTYKEVGLVLQDTIQRIADKYNLSLQKAEEKVTEYWEN